jgi:hypothetical protein
MQLASSAFKSLSRALFAKQSPIDATFPLKGMQAACRADKSCRTQTYAESQHRIILRRRLQLREGLLAACKETTCVSPLKLCLYTFRFGV